MPVRSYRRGRAQERQSTSRERQSGISSRSNSPRRASPRSEERRSTLPANVRALSDAETGEVYYAHDITGDTAWSVAELMNIDAVRDATEVRARAAGVARSRRGKRAQERQAQRSEYSVQRRLGVEQAASEERQVRALQRRLKTARKQLAQETLRTSELAAAAKMRARRDATGDAAARATRAAGNRELTARERGVESAGGAAHPFTTSATNPFAEPYAGTTAAVAMESADSLLLRDARGYLRAVSDTPAGETLNYAATNYAERAGASSMAHAMLRLSLGDRRWATLTAADRKRSVATLRQVLAEGVQITSPSSPSRKLAAAGERDVGKSFAAAGFGAIRVLPLIGATYEAMSVEERSRAAVTLQTLVHGDWCGVEESTWHTGLFATRGRSAGSDGIGGDPGSRLAFLRQGGQLYGVTRDAEIATTDIDIARLTDELGEAELRSRHFEQARIASSNVAAAIEAQKRAERAGPPSLLDGYEVLGQGPLSEAYLSYEAFSAAQPATSAFASPSRQASASASASGAPLVLLRGAASRSAEAKAHARNMLNDAQTRAGTTPAERRARALSTAASVRNRYDIELATQRNAGPRLRLVKAYESSIPASDDGSAAFAPGSFEQEEFMRKRAARELALEDLHWQTEALRSLVVQFCSANAGAESTMTQKRYNEALASAEKSEKELAADLNVALTPAASAARRQARARQVRAKRRRRRVGGFTGEPAPACDTTLKLRAARVERVEAYAADTSASKKSLPMSKAFLIPLRLERYADCFDMNGYDSVATLAQVTTTVLEHELMMSSEHASDLLAFQVPSPPLDFKLWYTKLKVLSGRELLELEQAQQLLDLVKAQGCTPDEIDEIQQKLEAIQEKCGIRPSGSPPGDGMKGSHGGDGVVQETPPAADLAALKEVMNAASAGSAAARKAKQAVIAEMKSCEAAMVAEVATLSAAVKSATKGTPAYTEANQKLAAKQTEQAAMNVKHEQTRKQVRVAGNKERAECDRFVAAIRRYGKVHKSGAKGAYEECAAAIEQDTTTSSTTTKQMSSGIFLKKLTAYAATKMKYTLPPQCGRVIFTAIDANDDEILSSPELKCGLSTMFDLKPEDAATVIFEAWQGDDTLLQKDEFRGAFRSIIAVHELFHETSALETTGHDMDEVGKAMAEQMFLTLTTEAEGTSARALNLEQFKKWFLTLVFTPSQDWFRTEPQSYDELVRWRCVSEGDATGVVQVYDKPNAATVGQPLSNTTVAVGEVVTVFEDKVGDDGILWFRILSNEAMKKEKKVPAKVTGDDCIGWVPAMTVPADGLSFEQTYNTKLSTLPRYRCFRSSSTGTDADLPVQVVEQPNSAQSQGGADALPTIKQREVVTVFETKTVTSTVLSNAVGIAVGIGVFWDDPVEPTSSSSSSSTTESVVWLRILSKSAIADAASDAIVTESDCIGWVPVSTQLEDVEEPVSLFKPLVEKKLSDLARWRCSQTPMQAEGGSKVVQVYKDADVTGDKMKVNKDAADAADLQVTSGDLVRVFETKTITVPETTVAVRAYTSMPYLIHITLLIIIPPTHTHSHPHTYVTYIPAGGGDDTIYQYHHHMVSHSKGRSKKRK